MSNHCPNCQAQVQPSSKFCQECGTSLLKACGYCKRVPEPNAAFCNHCGQPLEETEQVYDRSSVQATADEFMQHFQQRLKEDGLVNVQKEIYQRLLQSEFRPMLDRKMQQITDTRSIDHRDQPLVNQQFYDTQNYFLHHFAADILPFTIPPAVFVYRGKDAAQVDKTKLVLDFLKLDTTPLKVYYSVLDLPKGKIQQFMDSFLKAKRGERIYFIVDQSTFGIGKSGWAMSDQGIYWKTPFEPAAFLYYSEIEQLQIEENWLSINGLFFHVSAEVDIRLLYLLRFLSFK